MISDGSYTTGNTKEGCWDDCDTAKLVSPFHDVCLKGTASESMRTAIRTKILSERMSRTTQDSEHSSHFR